MKYFTSYFINLIMNVIRYEIMKFDFYKRKKNNSINNLKLKLFDKTEDAFFVLIISSHNEYDVPFINESAYLMFEILPDKIFINTVLAAYETIHQEDKKTVKQSLIDTIRMGNKWEITFRVQLPIKGLCWLKLTSNRETNIDGNVVFYVRISDVSKLKRKELKLKIYDKYFKIGMATSIASQKEKELELIKKVELYTKNNYRLLNFSYIVSHNLNSHVGNLNFLLDMIDAEEKSTEKQKKIKELRTVSSDLNRTINEVSQIINIENNTDIVVESVHLNTYINRVLNIVNGYNHTYNKIEIINTISNKATINFNPSYMESILQNLCTNAIEYANPDKLLIIQFDYFIEYGKKVLTVKDNGLGIDLEKYGHLIFGMYKTFHKNKNLKGIGLYITRKQIESMNATITVESQVGKGTTFKIVFED